MALAFSRPASRSVAAAAHPTRDGPLGEPGELRRAGLLARGGSRKARGPIWGKLRIAEVAGAVPELGEDRAFAGGGADRGREGVGVVIPTLLTYPGRPWSSTSRARTTKTAARRHELGDRVFKFNMRRMAQPPLQPVRRGCGGASTTAVLRDAAARQQSGRGEGQGDRGPGRRRPRNLRGDGGGGARAQDADDRRGHDLLTEAGALGSYSKVLLRARSPGRPDRCSTRFAGQPEKVLGSYMSVLFDGASGSGPIRTCGRDRGDGLLDHRLPARTRRASSSASARRTSACCRR